MGGGNIVSREATHRVGTEPAARPRAAALAQGLGGFAIYLGLSFLFFGRALTGNFSGRFIGREADPSVMMWLLGWWPYALSHHLNPFLTDYVWAPVGFNFAWMTSIPLPALLSAPLTHWWGIVPAYNILAILS